MGLPISPTFIAEGATLIVANNVGGDATGGICGDGTIVTSAGAGIGVEPSSGNFTFAGSVTGAGRFVKRQAGTQVLTGGSDYSRSTEIVNDGGTLQIGPDGNVSGTSGVTYGSNATLHIAGGTLDTPGNIRPVANSAVLRITDGLLKANAIDRTVNSSYLSPVTWTSGTIHLLSAITITNTATAIDQPLPDTVTLDGDMALVNDETISVAGAGVLVLDGGTVDAADLPVTSSGRVEFNSGSIRLRSDQTFDSTRLAELDIMTPLAANRSLTIDGVATVEAPLVLAGGTLSAGQIVNPDELILSSGTLEVTGGDLTIAGGEAVDITSGMTIDVTTGALVNDGELNAINASLSFFGGVANNGDLNLINSTVDGDLINGSDGAVTLLGSNAFGDDLELSAASALILAAR